MTTSKRARLTTSADGHQHLVQDNEDVRSGETSWENDSQGRWHSHAFVRNEDGTIEVGVASGHSHDVETTKAGTARKIEEENDMTTITKRVRDLIEKGESLEHLSKGEALEAIEDVDEALESLAKARAAEGGVAFAKAYEDVLHTEEGDELYSLRNDLQAIAT